MKSPSSNSPFIDKMEAITVLFEVSQISSLEQRQFAIEVISSGIFYENAMGDQFPRAEVHFAVVT